MAESYLLYNELHYNDLEVMQRNEPELHSNCSANKKLPQKATLSEILYECLQSSSGKAK